MMVRLMNFLYAQAEPIVETRWFEIIMTITVFLNPLAIFPQLLTVLTAPSVTGVTVTMWYVFAIIQIAFIFHGIKTKSASIFFSMLISLLENIAIITTVYVRG
ncbi:hypothetical protein HYV70_02135 [Candidatus Uhrbacteria bacterium]|nr:hypothetical protein [Candidatus Uhrbacteria bacterium]